MKTIWWLLKAALLTGSLFLAVWYSSAAQKNSGIITAFLQTQALNKKTADTICGQEAEREEALYLCFWGEQEERNISCRETGQSSTVSLIVADGNSDLVILGTEALLWQEKGCFIDTSTAVELFGTKQAAGQIIWDENTAYTVCGTFESLRKLMIRQIQAEDGETLTAASIRLAENKNVSSEMEQFLLRYGLSGESVDFVFLNALVSNLLLLAPIILVGKFLYALLRYGKKAAPSVRGRLLLALPAALSVLVLLWLLKYRLEIPADMIPSKWSDFSFWTTWWTGQRQNLFHIIGTAQGEMQFDMIWNLGKSFFCSAAAALLAISFG